MRTRTTSRNVLLVAAVAMIMMAVLARSAREKGAFGCEYDDTDRRTVSWTLGTDDDPSELKIRLGEGISLAGTDGASLQDVEVTGDAGLAPGTQNGIRGYVFRVTATGEGRVTARSSTGVLMAGSVRATC